MKIRVLAAFGESVMDEVERDEARAMKARGEAFFCNHGKDLRLTPTAQQEHDRREQKGSMEEWRTVHASELCIEQKRAFGSRFLRVTTLQYQPA